MTLLILGISLWVLAHWFKRIAPAARARLGDPGKGLVTVLLVSAIVLMVWGYRQAEFIVVWYPPSFFGHINNLLMLLAFYTFGASAARPQKVWLGTKLRHPQLTGFGLWAIAHLLANGDLASIVLFGGLLIWAAISARIINAAEGPWTPPEQAPVKKEITLVIVTLVLFSLVSAVHIWLGVNPFGGL